MKYRMIERYREAYPVRMMCRLLGVSASGSYDAARRRPSRRALANAHLVEQIRVLHAESDGVMGSPRITGELRYRGERCSRNRVARLMREAELRGIPQKRRWTKKTSGRRPSDVVNRLDRNFVAERSNEKWVTDIGTGRLARILHKKRGQALSNPL